MKIKLALIFVILSFGCNRSYDGDSYEVMSYQILSQIVEEESKQYNIKEILIQDAQSLAGLEEYLSYFWQDSSKMQFKDSILKQVNKITPAKWQESISTARMIEVERIDNLFTQTSLSKSHESWQSLRDHYGQARYYISSPPIFFDNQSKCIVYLAMSCEGLCGDGRLLYYEKSWFGWEKSKVIECWAM